MKVEEKPTGRQRFRHQVIGRENNKRTVLVHQTEIAIVSDDYQILRWVDTEPPQQEATVSES